VKVGRKLSGLRIGGGCVGAGWPRTTFYSSNCVSRRSSLFRSWRLIFCRLVGDVGTGGEVSRLWSCRGVRTYVAKTLAKDEWASEV
jgi:hypothetical protein